MYRKLFSFLALSLILLTGCTLQDQVDSPPVPQASGVGTYRWFDLQHTNIGTGTYQVTLQTGPFLIQRCMCRVVKYELLVSPGTASQWSLMLEDGQTVPFFTSIFQQNDQLDITDVEPIFAALGNPGSGQLKAASTNAMMTAAGGLCIIENYDGTGVGNPPVGTSANGPVIVTEPGHTPGSFHVKVYIPVDITTPV